MTDQELKKLTDEVREEFQIPPYFSENSLKNYVSEGIFELTKLIPTIDFVADLHARSILKNYVLYAYNKKLDEFFINYNPNILRLQLSQCKPM